MSERTYIYGLRDPLTGLIRYVGKADFPEQRFRQHLKKSTNQANRKWIGSLLKLGLRPELIVLEAVSQNCWCEAEARWIAKLRREGNELTNVHKGGEHRRASSLPRLPQLASGSRGPKRRVAIAGNELKRLRMHHRLTQPALAELAGLSVGTISRLEKHSGRTFPHVITRLTRALRATEGSLIRLET